MDIYKIHDTSDSFVVDALKREFSLIDNNNIIRNYHPKYSSESCNIFNVLDNGRYFEGHGAYYVILDGDKYICSAGWNQYDLEDSVALALTRMYVTKSQRNNFLVGKKILPLILNDTLSYKRVWITNNQYNKSIYNWFSRANDKKSASLSVKWPDIYKQFKPIGQKEVYYVLQDVVELIRS